MPCVYVFEVSHPRKGLPFQVRLHAQDELQAAQRAQAMHPLSHVRLLQTQACPLAWLHRPASVEPPSFRRVRSLSASAVRGQRPGALRRRSLI